MRYCLRHIGELAFWMSELFAHPTVQLHREPSVCFVQVGAQSRRSPCWWPFPQRSRMLSEYKVGSCGSPDLRRCTLNTGRGFCLRRPDQDLYMAGELKVDASSLQRSPEGAKPGVLSIARACCPGIRHTRRVLRKHQ